MNRRFFVVASLMMLALAVGATGVLAENGGTKQVGLVIAYPDAAEHVEIVTVPAAATTFDVLQAADIDLVSENTDFGPALCSIDNVGCPADNCFCDPAHFWAYYHLNAEATAWASAQEGIGAFVPADRAVEGLAWSGFDTNYNPTTQPTVYTFGQIEDMTSSPEPVSIPEPSTLLLLASGAAGLAVYARSKVRR